MIKVKEPKLTIDFKNTKLIYEGLKKIESNTTDKDKSIERFKIDPLPENLLNIFSILKDDLIVEILS
jgi:hypothetical protein